MNFSDEHYVRIYTRDTKTWLRWGWEGQCVFMQVMRKLDKSGVIDDIDDPIVDISLVTGLPQDVVAVGLPRVLGSGALELTDGHLVAPKYIDAQTASKSDRQRSKERRERRRDKARTPGTDVTIRDAGVTKRDATDRVLDELISGRGAQSRDESDRERPIPVGSVTKRDESDGKRPNPVENDHQLQRSATQSITTTPLPPAGGDGSGRDDSVPCPADLTLTSAQRGTLETALIPGWAIDELTTRFVSKSLADPEDRRTLVAWRKCLSKAISGDWNNSRTRPRQPEGRADETGGYGSAEEWS